MSVYIKSKHPKQNFKYTIKILRYIIPAIVGREVGLANLEAEFYVSQNLIIYLNFLDVLISCMQTSYSA